MASTAQELIDGVVQELRLEAAKVVARRRRIHVQAERRLRWGAAAHARLHARSGTWFTTDQTGGGDRLKLIVNGRCHAADLVFDGADGAPRLRAVKSFSDVSFPSAGALLWSGRKDAGLVRKYIEACSEKWPPKSAEFEIQLRLFDAFAGRRAAVKSKSAWAHLQPVMPFGVPTEVPTVVNKDGKQATGNIDILLRSGHGHRGQLVVLEIKPKLKGRVPVVRAFAQAIRYAAALSIEANGEQPEQPLPHVRDYWLLFGPDPLVKPGHERKPIVVQAALALPASMEKHALSALESLGLADKPTIRGVAMRVGLLLYEESGGRIEARWVDHAGSWQPT